MKKNMCVCVYIYITESLGCTPDSNTTLLINYTSIKKKKKEGANSIVWGDSRLSPLTMPTPSGLLDTFPSPLSSSLA